MIGWPALPVMLMSTTCQNPRRFDGSEGAEESSLLTVWQWMALPSGIASFGISNTQMPHVNLPPARPTAWEIESTPVSDGKAKVDVMVAVGPAVETGVEVPLVATRLVSVSAMLGVEVGIAVVVAAMEVRVAFAAVV